MLVDRRGELGLSQHDVALRMGTSQAWVSRVEAGWSTPSVVTLDRYATALGARFVLNAKLEQVA